MINQYMRVASSAIQVVSNLYIICEITANQEHDLRKTRKTTTHGFAMPWSAVVWEKLVVPGIRFASIFRHGRQIPLAKHAPESDQFPLQIVLRGEVWKKSVCRKGWRDDGGVGYASRLFCLLRDLGGCFAHLLVVGD